jgi:hypothetical protein
VAIAATTMAPPLEKIPSSASQIHMTQSAVALAS